MLLSFRILPNRELQFIDSKDASLQPADRRMVELVEESILSDRGRTHRR